MFSVNRTEELDNTVPTEQVAPIKEVPAQPEIKEGPVFKNWKGEVANEMLAVMWDVSGGDKDFILTMMAENGTFEPFRKHPNQNRDGSFDYSFGLNSYYHKAMIARVGWISPTTIP